MYPIIAYIRFLWRSKNQHGVHSPFVYGLVTRCFYDRKKYPAYKTIKKYRRALLQNKETIEVTDFGAGSRVFTSSERKISSIAKTAGITPKRARLLNRLVRYLKIESALELGTSLGISTAAMAAGNNIRINTLEGCPATAKVAQQHFQKYKVQNIHLLTGEFKTILTLAQETEQTLEQASEKTLKQESEKMLEQGSEQTLAQGSEQTLARESEQTLARASRLVSPTASGSQLPTYDLVFFDGNHQKQATLDYFETLLPHAHNNSLFLFDDIHWSKEMTEAWETIKAHPSVTVTIDTFSWGLVFFRKEQEKEHFVIRT